MKSLDLFTKFFILRKYLRVLLGKLFKFFSSQLQIKLSLLLVTASRSSRHLLSTDGINCTPPAVNEFPSDGLTREQRKNGWVVLHTVLACYLFILLATVCDDYFVPAIKLLCDSMYICHPQTNGSCKAVACKVILTTINAQALFGVSFRKCSEASVTHTRLI